VNIVSLWVSAQALRETVWFKLCGHSWCVQHGVVLFFCLCRRDIPDWFQKTAVVEPIDPFEHGELHGFEVAPRSPSMDDLGLVKTIDRFGQSVVVTVANASDRRLDAASASRSE
jgi:hypothetical protein